MIAWEPAINKVDACAIEELKLDAAEDLLEEYHFTDIESPNRGLTVGRKVTTDYHFVLFVDRKTPRIKARVNTDLDPDWIKPRLYGEGAIRDAEIVLNATRNHWCSDEFDSQGRKSPDPMVG